MDNSETQEIFNSIKDKLRHWTSSVFYEFYGLQKLGSLYYYTDMNALLMVSLYQTQKQIRKFVFGQQNGLILTIRKKIKRL